MSDSFEATKTSGTNAFTIALGSVAASTQYQVDFDYHPAASGAFDIIMAFVKTTANVQYQSWSSGTSSTAQHVTLIFSTTAINTALQITFNSTGGTGNKFKIDNLALCPVNQAPMVTSYRPDLLMHTDYYAFGQEMPGRTWVASDYRYGMNTQEKDNEIFKGAFGAKFWEYDSRIGRRWNIDPVVKEFESPYACFGDNPVLTADPLGDDGIDVIMGVLIGAATNVFPNSTSLREKFTPTDAVDYNNALRGMDNAAAMAGGMLTGIGGAQVTAGAGMAVTGVGLIPGVAVAAEGAVVAGTGILLQANSDNNRKAGYNYGETTTNSGKKVEPYTPKDPKTGEALKTKKSPAGNTKIDPEAKGKSHTQLRQDKSGNYSQRTTFDSKGRKRSDTHFTTHKEKGKTNPHKHTYYKNGQRAPDKGK